MIRYIAHLWCEILYHVFGVPCGDLVVHPPVPNARCMHVRCRHGIALGCNESPEYNSGVVA